MIQEYEATPCTTGLYELGESCRWDEVRNELYWVDILTGRFFRATADAAAVEITAVHNVDGFISAIAPCRDRSRGWVVAVNQGISLIDESGLPRELSRPEANREALVRMNDGCADPWGRFWFGSMAFDVAEGQGVLYRYQDSTGSEVMLRDVTNSNGIGWSPDRSHMYYVDSGPAILYLFDVSTEGEISEQRLLIQFDEKEGVPDGLCVDAEGAIWIAVWGASQVRRYSPHGELIGRLDLPTSQPSSCAIGGANGTTLYVTTAREEMSELALASEPHAGRVFSADVGVPGLPIDSFYPGE